MKRGVNTWCKAGANVHFYTVPYTAMGVAPMFTHMMPNFLVFDQMLAEIVGIFSGDPQPAGCTNSTITLPVK